MRGRCSGRVGVVVMTFGAAMLLIGLDASCAVGETVKQEKSGSLVFTRAADGGYAFDTGVLRGRLEPGKRTLGLSSVVHVPSGTKLDGSHGILSYYRVFTTNKRYGHAAWDWPCDSKVLPGGELQVYWPGEEDHPFEIFATYRWVDESTLDLETVVKAEEDLKDFEVFLASYLDKAFGVPSAYVNRDAEAVGMRGFLKAKKSFGPWQMFPRDADVMSMIQDGRWTKEPNPVAWTIMPPLEGAVCMRRGVGHDLSVVLMSPPEDCFAISMPYEGEGHNSLYMSLFGRDVKAGQKAKARCRLVTGSKVTNRQIVGMYERYVKEVSEKAW